MKYKKTLTTTIVTTLLCTSKAIGGAPSVPGTPPSGPSQQNKILVTTPPPTIQTLINSQPNSPYVKDFERGLLNVEAYGATGNVHSDDDTAEIQQALYDAYEYQLVCYFPTGTYDVSDTLDCEQAVDNHRRYAYSLLGEKGNPVSNRPVIRVKSGLGSFGSVGSGPSNASPKPVVKIWGKEYLTGSGHHPGAEKAGDCFNNVVRGIDFDLNNYSGAAGIYFAGAQGCSVEDVSIDATNGYCGFVKTIGVNGGYYNVKVDGGRYAIFNRDDADPVYPTRRVTDQFPIFAGCRFYNQTSRVIWTKGRSPATFVGFHIIKSNGPAFESINNSHEVGGGLTLMDGIIELTNPSNSLAIDNEYSNQGRSVYMKDVYIKNAGTIIKNTQPTVNVPGTSNGWTEILEYGRSYTAKASLNKKQGRNLINGAQSSETPDISTTDINTNFPAGNVPDPNALILNHVWNEDDIPAFDDPGVWDAVVDGGLNNSWGADVTSALNSMLQTHDKVFLPKGLYKISGTITIPGNTKFFGVCRRIAVIRPNYNAWDPGSEKYMIESGTSKDDSPYLSNIWLDFTKASKGKMISLIHWKAGRGSMIRNTFAWDQEWVNGNNGFALNPGLNKKLYRFSGNAGGRMYGLTNSWQNTALSSNNDNFRVIYVVGTREPLHFYGFNVERQLGHFQSEFSDAHNVAVFGAKTEGDNPKASVINRDAHRPMIGITNNCNNVIIGTSSASQAGCEEGWIHVIDSDNILVANIASQNHDGWSGGTLYMIWEKIGAAAEKKISAATYSSCHYQRGLTTLMDFDSPSNSNSDKTEIETLARTDSSGDGYTQSSSNTAASAGAFTWYGSNAVGDYISVTVNIPEAGSYQIYTGVGTTPTSGIFQLKVNGTPIGGTQDLYSTGYVFGERDTGTYTFSTPGDKEFRFEVTGKNASSSNYIMRLDYLRFVSIPNPDITEIETLARTDSSGDGYTQSSSNAAASAGALTWYGSNAVGDYITFTVNIPNAGSYHLYTGVGTTPTSGIVQLKVDGSPVGSAQDLYSTGYLFDERDLGTYHFSSAGDKLFRFEASGKNAASSNYIMRLDYLRLVPGANTAPSLSPISNITMNEGDTAIANLSATDAEGDTIILSVTGIPGFGTFTDNGNGAGTINFSPGYFDNGGPTTITVTADDGSGEQDTETFELTVNNVNRIPSLTPVNDITLDEDATTVINLSATDADGDPIALSATGIPGFATLTDNGDGTGSISFSPDFLDSGIYYISVTADDGNGGQDSESFDLTVANVNRAPDLTPVNNITVDEGGTNNISLSATDADNDSITLSATGMPNFGTLIDNGDGTGTVTLSPTFSDDGVYSIAFTADDGVASDTETITVTVNNINRQPAIGSIGSVTLEEESSQVVSIAATDPDGNDTLSLSAAGLPTCGSLTDNGDGTGSIVFSPAAGDAGNYSGITVTVDDGNATANTDSTSFDLTVNALPVTGVHYTNDFSQDTLSTDFTSNTSSFEIINGELSATSSAITGYKTMFLNTTDFPEDTDNFKIVSRMKKGTATGYKGAAVRFRHTDWSNYSELQIRSNAGDDVRVYTKANGSAVSPIDSWNANIDPESYNTYSIVVNGTNADVYINNSLLGSTTVGSIGKVGLTERKDVSIWDYFRVISIGDPDYVEDFDDVLAQDWNYDSAQFELSDTGGGDYVFKQSAGSSYKIGSYNAVVSVDANYSVSVDARVVGSRVKNWDSPHLVVKYTDPDNFISTYIDQDTTSGTCRLRLKKVIAGTNISDSLNTATTALSSVADWHKISAQVNGDKLTVSINGETVITDYVVAELNAVAFDQTTQSGVRSPTANVSAEFDNFNFFDEYQQP